jgi:hypothetical protein
MPAHLTDDDDDHAALSTSDMKPQPTIFSPHEQAARAVDDIYCRYTSKLKFEPTHIMFCFISMQF